MAMEFEALLLNQLTSTLNKTDDEEGGLFSDSGGGLSMSRQMFSEQLSKTLSQSGGIGLADLIMTQVGQNKGTKLKNETPVAAARALRSLPGSLSTAGAEVKESSSKLISNESVVATRPRRVHALSTASNRTTDISDVSSSASPSPKSIEIHSSTLVSLRLPARGAIRSVFGPRRDPINGRPRFHKGIDIAVPQGTPIQAAAAGRVVFSGVNKGYGNMVMLEHADGRRTLYAHAEALFVKVGDTVGAGQTIAAVGSTGHSTGPHVHFEIRVGDQAVNPLTAMANDFATARR
jgi:murein DD-endopeptidase MepM/ murein hydrolase activator NlpD